MSDILIEIAEKTKERVEQQKQQLSLRELKNQIRTNASKNRDPFLFEKALKKEGMSFICEVKKASPSKGIIAQDFPYVEIAKAYENGGASAISVLTEPFYFLGSNEYLKEIREEVGIPILRKDFVVDEYQIYEAKALNADACLLICSILEKEQLKSYLELAHLLGISALVETHDEEEIQMALEVGARIIGVNNRNLRDFSVNTNHSGNLRAHVPENILFVAESGISSKEQVKELKEQGVNAVLVGETFMRADNPEKAVKAYYEYVNSK